MPFLGFCALGLWIAKYRADISQGFFRLALAFAGWLDRFNGVATKYPSNYLAWRRMLEKSAATRTPKLLHDSGHLMKPIVSADRAKNQTGKV
ncbi:MAG: hypothetical protein HC850_03095 [Rhodomicrobium sp.]|nr:hypothetical protein [Rhodomicrobium sp.]